MPAKIQHLASDLYLIVLTPPISGFDDFIGAWLLTGPEAVCLIDVGPAVTADQLVAAIRSVGVTRLDYICLTHIHMDHAGAVGHIADQFPGTPVVCHPKGIPHLLDPQRLWEGTVNTLGDIGRAYGPMRPVDPATIASERQLAAAPFRFLDTPGHSPHHFAIAANGYLFAGEAAGVCLPLPSGDLYLRPATPPRFFLETSLASIDRIMAAAPEILCYGHLGLRRDAAQLLAMHQDQLRFWTSLLAEMAPADGGDPQTLAHRRLERMLARDPLLQGLSQLSPAAQARERTFLLNSIHGFSGYLDHRPADAAP